MVIWTNPATSDSDAPFARVETMTVDEVIDILRQFDPSRPLLLHWEGQVIAIKRERFEDCDGATWINADTHL